MSVDPSLAAPWRYFPQSHWQSSLPIAMTVKPTPASQMEWRFIEAPSVQFRVLLGALSVGLPPARVRVLPRSIGAVGTREGMVATRLIVLGGRGDSGGLPSGRTLAGVGLFHHLDLPQGAPADAG